MLELQNISFSVTEENGTTKDQMAVENQPLQN